MYRINILQYLTLKLQMATRQSWEGSLCPLGCDAKGARFGGYIHMTVIQVLYVDWTIHLQCKVSNTSSNGFIVLNFFSHKPGSWKGLGWRIVLSQEELLRPHGRVSFAGEYANKVKFFEKAKHRLDTIKRITIYRCTMAGWRLLWSLQSGIII